MESACDVLSFVALPVLHYFSTLSHKRHNFRKKVIVKCVFWFSLQRLCETFVILRRNQPDIVISVDGSSCKLPAILVRFKWNLNFVDIFWKHSNINFHEKPFGGSRVFIWGWTHRQTDMTKLIVAFRNFANPPKNYSTHQISSLYIDLLFG